MRLMSSKGEFGMMDDVNARMSDALMRIARELCNASKSAMSASGLSREIESMVGGDGFCIELPSGLYLACEYHRNDEEGLGYDFEYETAIVSKTYDGGEPHPNAVWFADMADLDSIYCKEGDDGIEVLNAMEVAKTALGIDSSIRIESFEDLKTICAQWDDSLSEWLELLVKYTDKVAVLSAVNSKLGASNIAGAIREALESLSKKLLGGYYYDYDFFYDDDPEKFDFLVKLNSLTDEERAYYENACDCMYYGEGKREWFKTCELSMENAEKVWNLAFEYMSHDWEESSKADSGCNY